MGQKIDRTGTFRGVPTSYGISYTTNEYPQFAVQLRALEYYDEENKEWVDWSEVDENTITAYLILFGKDKQPTLNAKQIQKALGWSGESFAELNNTDYSETIVQFRVESHTYQEKTNLQVNWIDAADAEPGRTVQKADDKEIRKMDAAYAHGLRKLGGGKTVVPEKAVTEKPKASKASAKTTAPPETKKKPEPTTGAAPKSGTKSCTKDEAWAAVNEAKCEAISNEQLEEIWLTTIDDLGDEKSFKGKDWYRVREIVKTKVTDDIPF